MLVKVLTALQCKTFTFISLIFYVVLDPANNLKLIYFQDNFKAPTNKHIPAMSALKTTEEMSS